MHNNIDLCSLVKPKVNLQSVFLWMMKFANKTNDASEPKIFFLVASPNLPAEYKIIGHIRLTEISENCTFITNRTSIKA